MFGSGGFGGFGQQQKPATTFGSCMFFPVLEMITLYWTSWAAATTTTTTTRRIRTTIHFFVWTAHHNSGATDHILLWANSTSTTIIAFWWYINDGRYASSFYSVFMSVGFGGFGAKPSGFGTTTTATPGFGKSFLKVYLTRF